MKITHVRCACNKGCEKYLIKGKIYQLLQQSPKGYYFRRTNSVVSYAIWGSPAFHLMHPSVKNPK